MTGLRTETVHPVTRGYGLVAASAADIVVCLLYGFQTGAVLSIFIACLACIWVQRLLQRRATLAKVWGRLSLPEGPAK